MNEIHEVVKRVQALDYDLHGLIRSFGGRIFYSNEIDPVILDVANNNFFIVQTYYNGRHYIKNDEYILAYILGVFLFSYVIPAKSGTLTIKALEVDKDIRRKAEMFAILLIMPAKDIIAALKETNFVIHRAGQTLGYSRNLLLRRLELSGINLESEQEYNCKEFIGSLYEEL